MVDEVDEVDEVDDVGEAMTLIPIQISKSPCSSSAASRDRADTRPDSKDSPANMLSVYISLSRAKYLAPVERGGR